MRHIIRNGGTRANIAFPKGRMGRHFPFPARELVHEVETVGGVWRRQLPDGPDGPYEGSSVLANESHAYLCGA
ncbi:hypothetical protein GCM10018966_012060 [Streptomyces yanii]